MSLKGIVCPTSRYKDIEMRGLSDRVILMELKGIKIIINYKS